MLQKLMEYQQVDKELKAIEQIISNIRAQGNVAEDNPQLQMAKDTRIKKKTAILSAARVTFTLLYYPLKDKKMQILKV